jgi:tetratricopeptide (TPR) repeat protein
MRCTLGFILFSALLPMTAPAQEAHPFDRGVAAMERGDMVTARRYFETGLTVDSLNYDANWLTAMVLIELGNLATADRRPGPDSLYTLAVRYARKAVAAYPAGADGHFALASAIGSASLTLGKRERIERAVEVRNEALKALGLQPEHAGAHHVLGRWHAEIMKLSDLQQFIARNFLGAEIFEQASWDEAERHLRVAVMNEPLRLQHRVELLAVLVEREKWDAAREQLNQLRLFNAITPGDQLRMQRANALQSAVTAKRRP